MECASAKLVPRTTSTLTRSSWSLWMTSLARCLWRFPTRSSPTVSCLCSRNQRCHLSCRHLACAVAESRGALPPPLHPMLEHSVHTCRTPAWPQGGSNCLELLTADLGCMDLLNNQYYLLLFCNCSTMTCTTLMLRPGDSPTSKHPSVYTWPQTTSFVGPLG